MKLRVAINGFGRIGRLFFRQAFSREEIEIVAINDLGEPENLAYLLQYDTTYGTFDKTVRVERIAEEGKEAYLYVQGKQIEVYNEKDPAKLPWGDLNIDIVVEASGAFTSFEKSSAHLSGGAKRVVISAPAKDPDGLAGQTILLGVNEEKFKNVSITSNASCTTNATSPVVQILNEELGIEKAILSTVHGYTATQNIVDGAVRGDDYRKGRAAAQNIIPSTTGAAIATTRAVPELEGKFDGLAFRVPVIAGSVADITFLAKKNTTVEDVNAILKKAADEPRWQGIFSVTEDPIVSSDIVGRPYGAVADLSFTKVIDGNLVKVLSWYDNEWGYTATLVEHVVRAGKTI